MGRETSAVETDSPVRVETRTGGGTTDYLPRNPSKLRTDRAAAKQANQTEASTHEDEGGRFRRGGSNGFLEGVGNRVDAVAPGERERVNHIDRAGVQTVARRVGRNVGNVTGGRGANSATAENRAVVRLSRGAGAAIVDTRVERLDIVQGRESGINRNGIAQREVAGDGATRQAADLHIIRRSVGGGERARERNASAASIRNGRSAEVKVREDLITEFAREALRVERGRAITAARIAS